MRKVVLQQEVDIATICQTRMDGLSHEEGGQRSRPSQTRSRQPDRHGYIAMLILVLKQRTHHILIANESQRSDPSYRGLRADRRS